MNKLLATAALAATMMVAAVTGAQAEWMALAMNYSGAGFSYGSTEAGAKVDALDQCRWNTEEQCYATVSVPENWYLVGIYCEGEPSVAGSQWSYSRALNLAAQKLGYGGYSDRYCYVDSQY